MSQIGQSDKKIVSKSKYLQVQSLRLGVGLVGFGLMFAALASLVLTIVSFFALLWMLGLCLYDKTWWSFGSLLVNVVITLFMIQGTRLLGKFATAALDRTDSMNNVVPLTKANAPYLPAQDSLVRASAEPPTAPETILLRAAAENATTPPEQLLRSTNALE